MNERDREKKLRALLDEAHRGDQPPAFRRTWEAAGGMRPRRVPSWALIPALGAAALLIVLLIRGQPRPPEPPQELQTAQWSREIGARLTVDTPVIGVGAGLGASGGIRIAALGPGVLGAPGPLDFLLQPPGSELLRTVPTFDVDRSKP